MVEKKMKENTPPKQYAFMRKISQMEWKTPQVFIEVL